MKVAIVTDSYHPTKDGVVAAIDTTKSVFDSNGVESVIIAPDPGKEEDRIEGVRYFKSTKFKKYEGYFVPVFPSGTKKVLKEIKPNIVHIEGVALMALKGVIAGHRLKIPVVMTFHTMVGDTMKYYSPVKLPQNTAVKLVWRYIRYITGWVDAIVAPSPAIERELREHGVDREIRVIPTPINKNRFDVDADPSEIRKKYNLDGKKVIISVGRVSFEKNLNLIIDALSRLDENYVLMLVGKGPAHDSLKKQAEDLGISDRVIFTGFVDNKELPAFYKAADISVIASRFETQCLSALEAMSTGLPVVCASDRAFKDYIIDGKNGYLFDNTVEGCVEKIKIAFESSDDLKNEARKTASEFSEESFFSKTMQLYDDLICGRVKNKKCLT